MIEDKLVQIDWKGYFDEFSRRNGGDPIRIGGVMKHGRMLGGRLLFPTGWQYNGMRYEGPEYPPPDDPKELHALQRLYWRTRQQEVDKYIQSLESHIQSLERYQAVLSCPLMISKEVVNEHTGNMEKITYPLNILELQSNLKSLKYQSKHFETELNKVGK